jgi:hypothetical protein
MVVLEVAQTLEMAEAEALALLVQILVLGLVVLVE